MLRPSAPNVSKIWKRIKSSQGSFMSRLKYADDTLSETGTEISSFGQDPNDPKTGNKEAKAMLWIAGTSAHQLYLTASEQGCPTSKFAMTMKEVATDLDVLKHKVPESAHSQAEALLESIVHARDTVADYSPVDLSHALNSGDEKTRLEDARHEVKVCMDNLKEAMRSQPEGRFAHFSQSGLEGSPVASPGIASVRVSNGMEWSHMAVWPVPVEAASDEEGALHKSLFSLQATQSTETCIMRGMRSTLLAGMDMLRLKPYTALTFDSCQKCDVRDLTITGGVVVCHGSTCNMSFSNVKFEDCTLVVLGKATVYVKECSFSHPSNTTSAIAVYADGEGVEVHLTDVNCSGGTQVAAAHNGAAMRVASCSISNTAASAFTVTGPSSSLRISDCTFEGCASQDHTGVLYLSNEASATLRGIRISSGTVGVRVTKNSQITLIDCNLSNTDMSCIEVTTGASAMLQDCTLAGSTNAHGCLVQDVGSHLSATTCEFAKNSVSGVVAVHGGSVTLTECKSSENANGFEAGASGQIEAIGCSSLKDGRGMSCRGGSLTASTTNVMNAKYSAACVLDQGTMTLNTCVVKGGEKFGIHASGEGTRIFADKCSVDGCSDACMYVTEATKAVITECTLTQSKTRQGLFVAREGTVVSAADCMFSDNSDVGVWVKHGAEVSMVRCASRNNAPYGFCASNAASLTLEHCTSACDGNGCISFSGGRIMAQHVSASDSHTSGFCTAEKGFMQLDNCTVDGGCEVAGISASDKGSSMSGNHCTVSGTQGSSILADKGAVAHFQNCELRESRKEHGLDAMNAETSVHAESCTFEGHTGFGAQARDYAVIRLNKCNSMGNKGFGFVASANGKVKATNCCVSGSDGPTQNLVPPSRYDTVSLQMSDSASKLTTVVEPTA